MAVFKDNTLTAGKLRRKLRIAVCLMSVLPLMVAFYIVANYILPRVGFKIDNVSITISVIILMGVLFFLQKLQSDIMISEQDTHMSTELTDFMAVMRNFSKLYDS